MITNFAIRKVNVAVHLLSISGADTIGIPEIYEKYMTFSGKN
jgi:hypothetical protein